MGGKAITPEIIQKIIELHNAGQNPNQMSKSIGVSAPTIKVYLRQAGLIPHRRHEGEQGEDIARFVAAVRAGADWCLEKDKYGFVHSKAKDILLKVGIPFVRRTAMPGMGRRNFHHPHIPKYSADRVEQIKQMKINGFMIREIVEKTDININTVKSVTKIAGIFIPKDEAERRAIAARLAKNPNYMQEMRKGLTFDVVSKRSDSIRFRYANDDGLLARNAAARSKKWWSGMTDNEKSIFIADRSEVSREAKLGMSIEEYEERVREFAARIKNGEGDFTNWARLNKMDPCTVLRMAHRLGFSDLVQVRDSWGERQVQEFVKSLIPAEDVRWNNRNAITPLELDVYVPNKNFAIEYNGLYWHCEHCPSYEAGKERRKYLMCLEKSISLLVIFEDEWFNPLKQAILRDMIRYRLGVMELRKYRASDLEIAEYSKAADLDIFFAQNHLDGEVSAMKASALKAPDGEIVAAASFRRTRDGVLELARFASKRGALVHGALPKLISGIGEDLVSFSNNRFGSGNLYKNCGFEEITKTDGPSYFYTDHFRRIRRERCMRLNPPDGITEEEFQAFPTEALQAHGGIFSRKIFGKTVDGQDDRRPLYRIEDCGHRKWIKYRKKS